MPYEYRAVRDYTDREWGFSVFKGEIYVDADFPEPDVPANLVGRGVLAPADMEAERDRLTAMSEQPEAVDADEDEE